MRVGSGVVERVSLLLLLQGRVAEEAIVQELAPATAVVVSAVRLRGVGRGSQLGLAVLEESRLRRRLHLRRFPGLGLLLRRRRHLSQEARVPGQGAESQ